MVDPFASPDGLRKWLEEFRPHEKVGYRDSSKTNPAALYLMSMGYLDPKVYFESYIYYPKTVGEPTPRWLYRFLINIYGSGSTAGAIQARTALRILNEVTQ